MALFGKKRKKQRLKSPAVVEVHSPQAKSHRPAAEKRVAVSAVSKFSVRAVSPVISFMTTP